MGHVKSTLTDGIVKGIAADHVNFDTVINEMID